MSNEIREIFISYVDDDGTTKDLWVNSITTKDGFVTFTTLTNEISIPNHRVIKIKKKIVGEDASIGNKNILND